MSNIPEINKAEPIPVIIKYNPTKSTPTEHTRLMLHAFLYPIIASTILPPSSGIIGSILNNERITLIPTDCSKKLLCADVPNTDAI